ncbi:hypothetical protein BCR36DRAFT_327458 [Piromyces finnis]|uniref:Uncharacterized protein n=1 Tax=Piromyces finnis TaxID=1754191 RepID=A0A1Y1VAR9_9FUNG|nr:hypothetical protein BCR36DRAFT_327458 [Piromyces finnis]|eukprot:ORX50010.1 hypothetical protein BCR36DRAFT_327458 [Piromyces finnis]
MNDINFKELLQHCVNILDSHHYFTTKYYDVLINNNINFYSEEELYEKYILNKKIIDENQQCFIKEVVFGCIRYHKIIKLLLKYLFEVLNSNLKEEDYTMFVVLTYLILFRLKELGYKNFKAFVDTQPTRKIYKLLEFIFNEENLSPCGCLKKIWKDLLDEAYIEKVILEPLRSVLHQNKKIMSYLEKKINLGMTVKKTSKVTKIKPFYLTKPKPRSIPEPTEIIYRKIEPTVLTKKILQGSNDREILQKKKEENKMKILKRHEKEKKNQFEIVKKTFNKPDKTSIECVTPPSPKFKLTKLPKFKPNNVKLNIATVLREEKLLQKRKKEKESDLNNIEIILNKNDFEEWRNKLQEKELEERKLNELKKRYEIQILHEDAIDAKEDLMKEKQEIVQHIKEEKEENQKFIEKNKKLQDQINKEFIKQVHDIEYQANEAKKKVAETKKKKADEIKDESKEIKIQIQKQQEEELEKKAELIKQIRLLEKYVMNNKPEVDLTETQNYGFLNEMSIVELKQRLVLAKEAAKEEEQRQRELILKRKKEKNSIMNKIRQNIQNDRIMRTEQRIKNEKSKLERQKRLDNLISEKVNVLNNDNLYSSSSCSMNTMTSNLDSIQSLVYQLQQRKEQRLKKRRNKNRKYEKTSLIKSIDNSKFKNQESTIVNINTNDNNNKDIYLPILSDRNNENCPPINNNNTINLTLKSDKFVVISNNEDDIDQSTINQLPNVYKNSNNNGLFNNIYPSKENEINEKIKKPFSELLINSSFISTCSDKNSDFSSIEVDVYTKRQLKNAEKNYERKINILKHQEKLYNEEILKKQLDKKNLNVNFQISEIKSQ